MTQEGQQKRLPTSHTRGGDSSKALLDIACSGGVAGHSHMMKLVCWPIPNTRWRLANTAAAGTVDMNKPANQLTNNPLIFFFPSLFCLTTHGFRASACAAHVTSRKAPFHIRILLRAADRYTDIWLWKHCLFLSTYLRRRLYALDLLCCLRPRMFLLRRPCTSSHPRWKTS